MTITPAPFRRLLMVALLAIVGALAACADQTPDDSGAPIGGPTADASAPAGSEGPAAPVTDLGTPDNPLVMSFVPSGETEEITTGGGELAELLSDEMGLTIDSNVATSYAAVIESMGAGNTHIAWLNTFSYILAREKYDVDVVYVAERFGSTTYAGQFLVRADSDIASLADVKGHSFCRPDPLSTSGWIVPSVMLRAAGIDPDVDLGDVVNAQGHDGVVRAVYNGDCDVGASYVDARGAVEDDLPNVMDEVVVIAVTDDIPNDNVTILGSLPPAIREAIVAGLAAVADTPEGREAMSTAYGIEALQPADDTFYDAFRVTLDQAGVDVAELAEQ